MYSHPQPPYGHAPLSPAVSLRSPSAVPSAPPADDHLASSAPQPSSMYPPMSPVAPRSGSFSMPPPQYSFQQPAPVPAMQYQQPMGGAVGAPIAVSIAPNVMGVTPPMAPGGPMMQPRSLSFSAQPPQQGYYPTSPVGGPAAMPPSPVNRHPSLHGGLGPVTPYSGPQVAPMMPMGANGVAAPPPSPSSVVELHFRAKNLKTADVFSESDPFIVIYLEEAARQWREIGRTETVVNSANPTFTKAIEIDYFFEEVQRIRLEIFDRDSSSEALTKHDFLGCVEFTMAQLMSSNGQSMVLALLQSGARHVSGISGHVVIDAEEVSSCADMVNVQFGADKIDNKDGWFGKSDPFLNIYRIKDEHSDPKQAASWIHVWRSPVVMNNLNPRWAKVTLGVRTLCNGNLSRLLKFECWDWEESGRHQYIGACTMTAGEFVSGERVSMDLINAERQLRKGKKYKNSGVLRIVSIECFKMHTFAEFLRGGCEISLVVGVDYTASNGAPSHPTSLHYMGNSQFGQLNEYQSAISATGAILEPYDHDRRFPVYGFGAIVNGAVNHCFPLTFDPTHPEVEGVGGIMQAYANSFPFIQLHGPTFFAPLINQAATIAQTFSQPPTPGMPMPLKYFVLLIITDGVIMDMDATVEAIVAASHLPLSIVIVGVGNADFSAMDALDADGKLLRARSGRQAVRDIVQFVPFNRYRSNPARLAKETLAEIPMQLTQHFRARGIKPNPPLQRAGTEMLIAAATSAAKSPVATQRLENSANSSQIYQLK
ncbi:hypothetical protein Poli38472_006867 [Pythium oligandrum]|uniref:C2 domain-containing protein n=1 Tax=Pythium oligandrum TaxID=41045 RepID=A0A8K1C5E9_PYTOL|nr:hypothetical protein Poli38472_006867 [Pythium oligandrum]|eukprot:TMW56857.1 hypothetical protein Poli38472_006867 [Pythium oligandrum]